MSWDQSSTVQLPRRLVIKLGTSTLCDASGSPDKEYLADFTRQLLDVVKAGVTPVIVTSGAIRAGLDKLAMPHNPKQMAIKQAAAAIGQGLLMQLYSEAFGAHGLVVAQILLTRDDFNSRERYVNATNTLQALMKLGVIPIVNENDTIAVDEIKVGDNDTLAALVASLVDADLLILLSDIDGLYDSDPNLNPNAKMIPTVSRIDHGIQKAARGTKGGFGTGGMHTKIEAAKIAMRSHIPMVIAHGRAKDVLKQVLEGKMGTRFESVTEKTISARKRWIATSRRPKGTLTIHEAAVPQLINRGKSLLPAGVVSVSGEFFIGDLVALVDRQGESFAQGIVRCESKDLDQIKGLQTEQARAILGQAKIKEVIHRDDMVISRETKAETGRGDRI